MNGDLGACDEKRSLISWHACSSVGKALAACLPAFSFDVVGIVAGYAVYELATQHAQPKRLLTFGNHMSIPGRCYGIASTPDGSAIYVSGKNCVRAFDADGNSKYSISWQDQAKREVWRVAFDNSGLVYLASYSDDVEIREVGPMSMYRGRFAIPPSECRKRDAPKPRHVNIAIRSDRVYVSRDNHVHAFDLLGHHLFTLGGHGVRDEQLDRPTAVAISSTRELFVSDANNRCIKVRFV